MDGTNTRSYTHHWLFMRLGPAIISGTSLWGKVPTYDACFPWSLQSHILCGVVTPCMYPTPISWIVSSIRNHMSWVLPQTLHSWEEQHYVVETFYMIAAGTLCFKEVEYIAFACSLSVHQSDISAVSDTSSINPKMDAALQKWNHVVKTGAIRKIENRKSQISNISVLQSKLCSTTQLCAYILVRITTTIVACKYACPVDSIFNRFYLHR